jgi:peptidoglycan/xylan/chitin deacetylase (PgdA/CDA1 family)
MGDSSWNWPHGALVAVCLTFDVDGEAGYLGEGEEFERRLTTLSEGRFSVIRGLPRILDLLRSLDIKATFFVPGYTAERHPQAVENILGDGHEVAHHGYLHLRSDKVSPQAQREEIERGFEALERAGAPKARGYRSTSWEMTPETFALLIEHDFAYDSSCMADDRPYIEEWNGHRLLELPVHWSLDDWPRWGWGIDGGGNMTAPAELYDSWLAEYESARAERRAVTYTTHPEVVGRAHRFARFEALVRRMADDEAVWFARMDQAAEHVRPALMGAPTT